LEGTSDFQGKVTDTEKWLKERQKKRGNKEEEAIWQGRNRRLGNLATINDGWWEKRGA